MTEDPSESDALVFFGATGDLAHKKIFPAQQGVQIPIAESLGVNGRGGFYAQTAAILDVVENHRLQVTRTKVLVEFKPPPCSVVREKMGQPNHLRFRLLPDEAIAIGLRLKAPCKVMLGQEVEFLALHGIGEMLAYERLLGDAMQGDAALFARDDTVEAEWRIVAPTPDRSALPHEHLAGPWRPGEADRRMDRPGGWHKPLPAAPRGSP